VVGKEILLQANIGCGVLNYQTRNRTYSSLQTKRITSKQLL
jgi:hypothetical protein